MTRTLGAVELGSVLGWMSRRVLGQYDLLWASDDETATSHGTASAGTAGDTVYFVGPNILVTEKRYAFVPAQFRLWLALHELTHRSQFTGVPWLRPHFLQLVNGLVDDAQPDPERVREGLRTLTTLRRSSSGRRNSGDDSQDLLGEGGLAAVFATEQQRELIAQVGGMMSLVEGHGDVTMARAARGHIPDADRFAVVMHHRRRNVRGMARLIQRLLGIEAKLAQYQAGEEFIAQIEAERGPRAVDRIWNASSTCRPWPRSATLKPGWSVSRRPDRSAPTPPAAGDGTAQRVDHELDLLLERCTFNDVGRHELTCAVSGGPDSAALLVLACRLARCSGSGTTAVTAVHVDHGLRPDGAAEPHRSGPCASGSAPSCVWSSSSSCRGQSAGSGP